MHFAGVLSHRTINVAEVSRARWRWSRHPSLKLYSPRGTQTIWFENFRGDQQQRLIHFFRERIRQEVQEGWNGDIERYAAEIETMESPAGAERVFRNTMRQVWRAAAFAAPVICLVFVGFFAFITWFAESRGVAEIPSWSGSAILDYAIVGAVVLVGAPVGLSLLFLMAHWIGRPEQPN